MPVTSVALPAAAHANNNSNLRAGPGTGYAVVGSAPEGVALDIVAQNAQGDWYQLRNRSWIAGFLVDDAPVELPLASDS